MADEKKTLREKDAPAKELKPRKENKFIAFCKSLPRRVVTPFKNMWHEIKKVTWPTRKDLVNYTCIVLLFMVFMGVVIGLLDMGASRLVTAISSLVSVQEPAASDAIDDTVDDNATLDDHDHDHDHENEADHDHETEEEHDHDAALPEGGN